MGARLIVAGLSDSWADTAVSRTDIVTKSVLAGKANMVVPSCCWSHTRGCCLV